VGYLTIIVHVLYGDQELKRTMKDSSIILTLIVHLQTPTCIFVYIMKIRCSLNHN
jgi:hypothetical protein